MEHLNLKIAQLFQQQHMNFMNQNRLPIPAMNMPYPPINPPNLPRKN
jgi:hypothetical protein